MNLDLKASERKQLLQQTLTALEGYYAHPKAQKVAAEWKIEDVRAYARALDFDQPNEAPVVLQRVLDGLTQYAVHTPHPNYFGLFNPRSNFSSTLADWITATFNPQLAAWSHAPFANEIERYLIQAFGEKMGYPAGCDGSFCTGGAEANLTALICALHKAFPNFSETGVRGVEEELVIYCSAAAHHSLEKAAKITGLGSQVVTTIPVNENLEMDIDKLRRQIRADAASAHRRPLLIVGTAGTTGAGAIDDLPALRAIATEYQTWFHVDAAYGGAIAVSEQYGAVIAGIETSDSITVDLHKWFSIPMGASLLLTKDKNILHQSFAIKTDYMPADGDAAVVVDPYLHSVQWSRRFIGLKMYLPLAIHGWQGYEKVIDHQVAMGLKLKQLLQQNGWEIRNDSPLPIICFTHQGDPSKSMQPIVERVNATGKAWLSTYPIRGVTTARVCITNYLTSETELYELIDILAQASVD